MLAKGFDCEASERLTEEDPTMLRLRLASLALVSSVLISLAGCAMSPCSEPMCPRVRAFFTSRSTPHETMGECDCHNGHIASTPEFPPMPGPLLVPGQIPITTVPTTQPGVYRVPQASQVPSAPTIK